MEDHTKQFVGLFALLIVLTGSLAYYNYTTTIRFEQNMQALSQSLQQRLDQLDIKVDATREALSQDIQDRATALESRLESGLTTVNTSIESVKKQTQSQVQGLSGQIQTLEESSKTLEQKLLDINIQTKDFTNIIDHVIQGVVSIRTDRGVGSGAIIHEDGYVVTNYHVVDGISAAGVFLYDGERYPMRIVALSEEKDLALVKIDRSRAFTELDFGSSRAVKLGEKVIALGNPGGLDFTVTEGIVSAIGREGQNGVKYLQHDVAINPGNSGGPLVNLQGRIVGINTLKKSNFEGVGFAIEVDIVEDFVDPMIAKDIEALAQQ